MVRKAIQILVDKDGDITALCNDGSIWWLEKGIWREIAAIPSDINTRPFNLKEHVSK